MKLRGYFLLEVVIGILLIMITVAVVGVKGREAINVGKSSRATADVNYLGGVISQYKFEIGDYPATLEKLKSKNGDYGPWIREVPKDPWGRDYVYQKNADGFAVWSKGEDGNSNSNLSKIGNGDIGCLGK